MVRGITRFDAERFSSQIAAEVKDLDPHDYLDPKSARKMDRFILYAIVAADCAVAHADLEINESNALRIGVYIGSGIGGFETIEREHLKFLEKGPAPHFSIFHPGRDREPGSRSSFDSIWRQGSEFRYVHSLFRWSPCPWRFLPHHSTGRC